MYSIPVDVRDPDECSAVMEAMASEGYYTMSPAFFETALKVKYSSDNDSARMYDLIKSTIMFDFGRVFSQAALNSIPGKFRSAIANNNTNWASVYASSIDQYKKLLNDLTTKLASLET